MTQLGNKGLHQLSNLIKTTEILFKPVNVLIMHCKLRENRNRKINRAGCWENLPTLNAKAQIQIHQHTGTLTTKYISKYKQLLKHARVT